jgi:hypothetical protein
LAAFGFGRACAAVEDDPPVRAHDHGKGHVRVVAHGLDTLFVEALEVVQFYSQRQNPFQLGGQALGDGLGAGELGMQQSVMEEIA